MRTVLIVLLAILCLFPAPPVAADRGVKVKAIEDLTHANNSIGAYRALIIGIDEYQDQDIPKLDTAVADAKAVAELLKKRYGFQIDEQKDLLLNDKATGGAIYNALRRLATGTVTSDSVLIYYAGHGEEDTVYKDGWWIPADAKLGDPRTYLDNVQVQKAMGSMQARHVLLISDSCYSGTLFGRNRSLPRKIDDKYYLGLFNERSRWGMTSGSKTPVADGGQDGHSVFAYQLLKELRNNSKPYVTTQEVFTRIAPIISNNSEVGQVPLCKPIVRTGDQGGEFIFLLASSGAVVDSPVPAATKIKTLLSVTANVPGARVYVDGSYIGDAKLVDKEVTPGHHQVRVEKEGYQPYTRELTFRQGREKSLQAILDLKAPATGSLYIRTEPSAAAVRILNIGPKFSQGMELSPGRYHVEISASGYKTRTEWVELSAGEDKDLDIRLESTASATNSYESSAQPTPPAPSSDAGQGEAFTNSLGMKFVYISPGTFMMGSPSSEADREGDERQHRVTLTKGYYLQTTEVTQGQWQAVMGDNPSRFKSCGENCPVENVSWDDIQEFIKKLNQRDSHYQYRLPTEAEWEYAARTGSESRFCFGDSDETLKEYAWFRDNSGGKTHPVSAKRPNDWGLYDMHGNVWEWCRDRYDGYPSGSVTDPQGPPSGADRVLRGGSWSNNAGYCRSADRWGTPDYRNGNGGFRLAASLFSR
jgi:formylglycine-generating enzyme required for sulfatase activity